jgi:hypothetical protein
MTTRGRRISSMLVESWIARGRELTKRSVLISDKGIMIENEKS